MTTLLGSKENQELPLCTCLCTWRNAREQNQRWEQHGRRAGGHWGSANAVKHRLFLQSNPVCLSGKGPAAQEPPLLFPIFQADCWNVLCKLNSTAEGKAAPRALPGCSQTPQQQSSPPVPPSLQTNPGSTIPQKGWTAALLKKQNKMKWSNSALSQHKVSLAGKPHFFFFLLHRLKPFCFILSYIPTFHIFRHSLFPDS